LRGKLQKKNSNHRLLRKKTSEKNKKKLTIFGIMEQKSKEILPSWIFENRFERKEIKIQVEIIKMV